MPGLALLDSRRSGAKVNMRTLFKVCASGKIFPPRRKLVHFSPGVVNPVELKVVNGMGQDNPLRTQQDPNGFDGVQRSNFT